MIFFLAPLLLRTYNQLRIEWTTKLTNSRCVNFILSVIKASSTRLKKTAIAASFSHVYITASDTYTQIDSLTQTRSDPIGTFIYYTDIYSFAYYMASSV